MFLETSPVSNQVSLDKTEETSFRTPGVCLCVDQSAGGAGYTGQTGQTGVWWADWVQSGLLAGFLIGTVLAPSSSSWLTAAAA